METFSNEVKQAIIFAQHDFCAMKDCFNQIHSIHHKLRNTEFNRKNFPLFIHSPFNAVGLCSKCHRDYSKHFEVTEFEAEMYEEFLNDLILGAVAEERANQDCPNGEEN